METCTLINDETGEKTVFLVDPLNVTVDFFINETGQSHIMMNHTSAETLKEQLINKGFRVE